MKTTTRTGVFCTPVSNSTDDSPKDSEEAGTGGQRIFGGEGADVREFPYQISMRWTYGSPRPMHFCGGSIIDESHIVTAAHCVDDKRSPDLLRYIRVYTGTSRSDGHGGNVRAVKAVAIHPGYRGAANTYLNDIAIVTVSWCWFYRGESVGFILRVLWGECAKCTFGFGRWDFKEFSVLFSVVNFCSLWKFKFVIKFGWLYVILHIFLFLYR